MRRAARIDANQPAIVDALRRLGCSVQVLSAVGGGCCDLAVGIRGINLFVEIKDGSRPPAERQLTPDQMIWHRDWRGQKMVVESVDQAIERIVGRRAA